MEKKDFSKLCDDLQYFTVENPMEKILDEIKDEIREFIEKNGYETLEEDWNTDEFAAEWMSENHPEITDFDDSWVCDLEFLCKNEYECEHDVDWKSVTIVFHGDWDKGVGVFSVEQI